MDLDLYRYFIGRADQSVNESIMVKRVDQQLRVTRHMIDCQDLDELKDQKRLHAYMVHYLSVMMAVSDIFLLLDGSDEAKAKRTGLWQYLKDHVSTGVYRAVRYNLGGLTDLKFPGGDKLTLASTASCARSSSSTDSLKFTPSSRLTPCQLPQRGSLWQNGTPLLLARASLREGGGIAQR